MTTDENILNKVRGLLAMAERTDNADEAEAFSAKAAEMIDKYRIDVARLTPKGQGPDFRQERIVMAGIANLRASVMLLNAVAKHYGVTILIGSTGNQKAPQIIGDADDILTVRMIFASLVIQRDRAVHALPTPYGVATVTFRNSFAYGYAERINTRLKALRAAQRTEAKATGDTAALVLFDRKDQVAVWLRDVAKVAVSKSNLNAATIHGGSREAGQAAASRADLGGSRIGGNGPRELAR